MKLTRLKVERMRRRLKQSDLGLDPTVVSKLENGSRTLTTYYADVLARGFGVSADEVRAWASEEIAA